MSHTNKHRVNRVNSMSVLFMRDELGPRKTCPRRSCKGTCVEVLVRYVDHGPINYENECTVCGKVIKDPRFKKEREKRWRQNKQKWENRNKKGNGQKKYGGKKNASNTRSS